MEILLTILGIMAFAAGFASGLLALFGRFGALQMPLRDSLTLTLVGGLFMASGIILIS